ncbi:MAG TPA: hypothetical protein VEI46_11160, partial [Thermodesulfovibrionales bacterium]|nr:hypothetical protein [Thermodesulfovibrionales bacterium]
TAVKGFSPFVMARRQNISPSQLIMNAVTLGAEKRPVHRRTGICSRRNRQGTNGVSSIRTGGSEKT